MQCYLCSLKAHMCRRQCVIDVFLNIIYLMDGKLFCPFLYLVSPLFVKPEFMHSCLLLYGECSFWTAFDVINMLSVCEAFWPSVEIPLMSRWKWWFAVANVFILSCVPCHSSDIWFYCLLNYEAVKFSNLFTMNCQPGTVCMGILLLEFRLYNLFNLCQN